MRSERRNYQKEALERYLRLKPVGEFNRENFYKSGFELLSLLFAYVRKQNGVHLRWNRSEANRLALMTIGQLKAKKKTNPVLNQIYDAILKHANQNKPLAEDLLNIAETKIDELSSSQRKKALTKRINLLDELIESYVRRNEFISTEDVISRLHTDKGNGDGVIINIDHNQVTYKHEKKVKSARTAAISGIGNRVTNARKKIRAEKQHTLK